MEDLSENNIQNDIVAQSSFEISVLINTDE